MKRKLRNLYQQLVLPASLSLPCFYNLLPQLTLLTAPPTPASAPTPAPAPIPTSTPTPLRPTDPLLLLLFVLLLLSGVPECACWYCLLALT